jgi:probable phosphoglycerate mutase
MDRRLQRPFTLPAGATEVLLVRHGSTDASGGSDPGLGPSGEAQGRAVGERLAAAPCAGLFVSGLRRTGHTARTLAQATGLAPVVLRDLDEVHLGDWGPSEFDRRLAARDPVMMRALDSERWDLLPGGESMHDLATRVERGLRQIVEATGPDARAVAFVHGGIIAEACRQATGSRPFAFLLSENGSITRLVRLRGGVWRLHGFNDVAHLAAIAGADVLDVA